MSETLEAMGGDAADGIPAAASARTYRAVVEGEVNGREVRP